MQYRIAHFPHLETLLLCEISLNYRGSEDDYTAFSTDASLLIIQKQKGVRLFHPLYFDEMVRVLLLFWKTNETLL